MRSATLLPTLALTACAQLLPFLSNQHPMAESDSTNPPSAQLFPQGDVLLSDIIGTQRTINIFASYTKDIDSTSTLLDTSSSNATVLAPLNGAITSLPRKPWEDPRDYGALGASAYSGTEGEDRAHRNLRRFTEAHIVPLSPWPEGEKVQNLVGLTVWWERRDDGKAYVMPGSVEVEKVASRVANGEVWILKGVVNYAS